MKVSVKSARMKDLAGLWYLEVLGDGAGDVDPRYSVHFDVGQVSRKQMVGKTVHVTADEPDFYLAIERYSNNLRVEVLEVNGLETKLRVSGRIDWEAEPTFEIFGWFSQDDDWMPL
jgi:hypothetical protein